MTRPAGPDVPPGPAPRAALSEEDRAALDRLTAPLRPGTPPTLLQAMHIKRLLADRLPPAEALAVGRAVLGLDDAVTLRRRPIRGLLEAVRSDGRLLHVFHPGGATRTARAPRFHGAGSAPDIHGVPRMVFAGALSDATVHSRSPAIRHGEALIFDLQPGELDRVPVEMAFDPVVFARTGETVLALEDSHPDRGWRMPRAWSLMGINSVSFGHWMCEQLPQFLAAADLPEFAGTPVLIDADMPAQHRQSLELFGAGRFPIVTVPRGVRVRVETLLVMSNWAYAPHLLVTDRGLDASVFLPAADRVAEVLVRAAARFDALAPPPAAAAGPAGVFWARTPRRHRAIANHAEIEAVLARHGYARHLPERHDFATQIGLLRGSDRVVLQNGSGMHGMFLGRPGTRVLLLSHPALPLIALFNAILEALGQDLTVITGPFMRRGEIWLDQSDYEMDTVRLDAFLAGWAGAPAPGG